MASSLAGNARWTCSVAAARPGRARSCSPCRRAARDRARRAPGAARRAARSSCRSAARPAGRGREATGGRCGQRARRPRDRRGPPRRCCRRGRAGRRRSTSGRTACAAPARRRRGTPRRRPPARTHRPARGRGRGSRRGARGSPGARGPSDRCPSRPTRPAPRPRVWARCPGRSGPRSTPSVSDGGVSPTHRGRAGSARTRSSEGHRRTARRADRRRGSLTQRRMAARIPVAIGLLRHRGGADSNRRPPAPKAGALPGCATPRVRERYGVRRGRSPGRPPVGSDAAMADVQPLRALHYDPAKVGLAAGRRRPAVRRDRPRAARRARRALALQRRRDRPARGEPRAATRTPTPPSCSSSGGRRRDRPRRRAGDLGARPGLHRPRRRGRTPAAACSRACGSRTTAPAGSARTSARTPARARTACASRARRRRTCRRSSACTPTRRAPRGARSSAATEAAPFGEATDDEGTRNRLWRVADPDAIATVQAALKDAELLIADGHHRYETARVYADEVGGEGEHRYVLMCLVALEDPGLTVFPTHRLIRDTTSQTPGGARRRAARETSTSSRSSTTSCVRPTATGRSRWATSTRSSSARSASR